jgi:hypothetical protein
MCINILVLTVNNSIKANLEIVCLIESVRRTQFIDFHFQIQMLVKKVIFSILFDKLFKATKLMPKVN